MKKESGLPRNKERITGKNKEDTDRSGSGTVSIFYYCIGSSGGQYYMDVSNMEPSYDG